ncbi:unnamed protein product [Protopolystoma xenopodis]|uniref:Uncharacterized protein n=1 Tax=Protopolystoma xenopodis TaxID=117903 RepID=A0A448WB00_9PLAT|nr:unnamed protein product [Protopolystoma xenopodis]
MQPFTATVTCASSRRSRSSHARCPRNRSLARELHTIGAKDSSELATVAIKASASPPSAELQSNIVTPYADVQNLIVSTKGPLVKSQSNHMQSVTDAFEAFKAAHSIIPFKQTEAWVQGKILCPFLEKPLYRYDNIMYCFDFSRSLAFFKWSSLHTLPRDILARYNDELMSQVSRLSDALVVALAHREELRLLRETQDDLVLLANAVERRRRRAAREALQATAASTRAFSRGRAGSSTRSIGQVGL